MMRGLIPAGTSLLSKMSFSWAKLQPTQTDTLRLDELVPLPSGMEASYWSDSLARSLEETRKKSQHCPAPHGTQNQAQSSTENQQHRDGRSDACDAQEKVLSLSSSSMNGEDVAGSGDPVNDEKVVFRSCLMRAILKTWLPTVLLQYSIAVARKLFQCLARPILMTFFIEAAMRGDSFCTMAAFFVGMFTCLMTSSWLQEYMFLTNDSMQATLAAALGQVLYNKIMCLSPTARKKYTSAELNTLLTSHAFDLARSSAWLITRSSALLDMGIIIYLLYHYTNLSSLALSILMYTIIVYIMYLVGGYQERLYKTRSDARDRKMAIVTQTLRSIKMIKLHSLEKLFGKKIENAFRKEVDILREIFVSELLYAAADAIVPMVVLCVLLLHNIFLEENSVLRPETLFSLLIITNDMRFVTEELPGISAELVTVKTALKPIEKILAEQEIESDPRENTVPLKSATREDTDHKRDDLALTIMDAEFAWDSDDPFRLSVDEFAVERGSLVAVVGSVGSGKTALLSAILHEMERICGTIESGDVKAYVPQEAWVLNDTLQNNVLFGKEFDKERYQYVLHACDLLQDIEALEDGDQTLLGEKGVNLSGGQKQRVSLARAAYSDANLFLLDDPLSAVDGNVGQRIFSRLIGNTGMLKNKTRLLVTHGMQWLPFVDKIYLVKSDENDKSRLHIVTCQEVMELFQLDSHQGSSFLTTNAKAAEYKNIDDNSLVDVPNNTDSPKNPIEIYIPSTEDSYVSEEIKPVGEAQDDNVVVEARPGFSSFLSYFRLVGVGRCLICMCLRVLQLFVFAYSGIFLTKWLEGLKGLGVEASKLAEYRNRHALSFLYTCPKADESLQNRVWSHNLFHVLGYVGFCIISLASLAFFQVLRAEWNSDAVYRLTTTLLWSVLRSPIDFFQKTSIGKLLLRFGFDVHEINHQIPKNLDFALLGFLNSFINIFIVCYTCPMVLFVSIPVIVLMWITQTKNTKIVTMVNSIIFKHEALQGSKAHETIDGAHVIRAFGQRQRFKTMYTNAINNKTRATFNDSITQRYGNMIIMGLSNTLVATSALLAALTTDSGAVGVGLAVAFAVEIGHNVAFFCAVFGELSSTMVSYDRVVDYLALESEAQWESENDFNLSAQWPQNGKIEYRNFSLSYGAGNVVENVSFTILPGQKVGIIGRTGAGKTSLALSLFRLVETTSGDIFVDDVSIRSLGLHNLRSKIAIIPQDPELSAGSLRCNLDPFGSETDEEIWLALRHVYMEDVVRSLPGGLDWECEEGGTGFSLGQRQLLCLARTLLRKTCIIVLDEATASVDVKTDSLIQATIREQFGACTVLTIAHRLATVMDYDKILVMDKGKVHAFDTPDNLRKDQLFAQMLHSAIASS